LYKLQGKVKSDDFRKLTIFRQVELLFEKGQHVLSRIYLFYNVHLYILSGFYVEIWYRQADNKIERVLILDQSDVLDLYDNQIGLSDITGCIGPRE
jgi:hypothetical protein